jgi:hypothetical protein
MLKKLGTAVDINLQEFPILKIKMTLQDVVALRDPCLLLVAGII